METDNPEIRYGMATFLGQFLEDWRHAMTAGSALRDERRNEFSARVGRLHNQPQQVLLWSAEIEQLVTDMLSTLNHLICPPPTNPDCVKGAPPAAPEPVGPAAHNPGTGLQAAIEQALAQQMVLFQQQVDKQIKAEVKRSVAAHQGHLRQEWEKILQERVPGQENDASHKGAHDSAQHSASAARAGKKRVRTQADAAKA